jgi:hypothetical protein
VNGDNYRRIHTNMHTRRSDGTCSYPLSIVTNQAFLPERQAVSKVDPLAFIQLRDGVNYRLPDSQSLEKPFDTAPVRRGIVKT